MPPSKSSLIHLKSLTFQSIEQLFLKTLELKKTFSKEPKKENFNLNKTAALLFFESSTRTRFSFETASIRAGFYPLIFDRSAGTSLEKGETVIDTILNINAMKPSYLVVRSGDDLDLDKIDKTIDTPIINAGWGKQGHPTQALLDALTLFEKWKSLSGKKILFVGDVKHSRVVASHFELAKICGYEIALCTPQEFAVNGYQNFSSLQEGLNWTDAVIALRVQKERHTNDSNSMSIEDYQKNYCLTPHRLKLLKPDGVIMHPGPINQGTDLTHDVLLDPRSLILNQVTNGTFLREAIIRSLKESL